MDADYSVEIGPTADALEIPWKDPDGRVLYVDLRGDPGSLERNVERMPEAQQFPALRNFLIEMNSRCSPWQTAKCDVWAEAAEPEENVFGAQFSHGCYIDVVLAGEAAWLRDSLETHQRLARTAALQLDEDELEATAEIVVRRCYFHHSSGGRASGGTFWDTSDDGYCLTLFLTGYGASPEEAAECWARTLELASRCLLELTLHEGRAKLRELS